MQSAHVPQAVGSPRGRLLALALCLGMLPCGCESMNNTDKGVLGGGLLGAGTGAAIGSLSGHTGAGAAIGGIAGAIGGGLVGNSVDQSERKQEARLAAATAAQHPPLTLQDVVSLAQQHVSDEIIVSQVRNSGSVYSLTADDIIWLKQNGVSDWVVREMQLTASYPRRVYTPVPVYAAPVVVEPAPVAVGFGFGFRR
jgi:hypothetical protein